MPKEIPTKIGIETEFILARYSKSNNRCVWIEARNVPILYFGGLYKRLGTDGADHTGELRLPPLSYPLWHSQVIKMIGSEFAKLWVELKKRRRGEYVVNYYKRFSIPCGTHVHLDWNFLRQVYGEDRSRCDMAYYLCQYFEPLMRMTKGALGDRSNYSSYGHYGDYRTQPWGVEIRGFESCMYQSPDWIRIMCVNINRYVRALWEKGEPPVPKRLPPLDSNSQQREWKVTIKQINSRKSFTPRILHFREAVTCNDTKLERWYRMRLNDRLEVVRWIEKKRPWEPQRLEQILTDINERVYVYSEGDKIKGTILYRRHSNTAYPHIITPADFAKAISLLTALWNNIFVIVPKNWVSEFRRNAIVKLELEGSNRNAIIYKAINNPKYLVRTRVGTFQVGVSNLFS